MRNSASSVSIHKLPARVAALLLSIAACAVANAALADPNIVQVTVGPDCPLPYSPYTHETATPHAFYDDSQSPADYDFLCSLDQDHDGLDDHIENLVAECFAPFVRFDSNENARHTRDGLPSGSVPDNTEPVGLYTMVPTSTHDLTATLHWVLVFDEDGGFYDYGGVVTSKNSHPGDTQPLDVGVHFEADKNAGWSAHLTRFDVDGSKWQEGSQAVGDGGQVGCTEPLSIPEWAATVITGGIIPPLSPFSEIVETQCRATHALMKHLEVADGTHPVVYLSAGKHHSFVHQQFSYDYTTVTITDPLLPDITLFVQKDRAAGDSSSYTIPTKLPGPAARPMNVGRIETTSGVPEDQATQACASVNDLNLIMGTTCACTGANCPPPAPPDFCAAAAEQLLVDYALCTGGIGSAQASNRNLCLKERLKLDVAANFVSDDDFFALGYAGTLSNTQSFCGSAPPGCDTEADAPVTWLGWKPSDPTVINEDGDDCDNFSDNCPLVANDCTNPKDDPDQDGAGNECDPAPDHYDRYVGPGDPLRNLNAHVSSWMNPGNGGWLDTDQDGVINGQDICPFTAGGNGAMELADSNWRGETDAFPAAPTGAYGYAYSHYGYAYRGNVCDPFETTAVHGFFPVDTTDSPIDCYYFDPSHPSYTTPNAVRINYAAVMGVSANDPALAPKGNESYADRAQVLLGKSKPVSATLERCACQPFDHWEQCANDPQSHCRKTFGLDGQDPIPQLKIEESGWHPLGPPGCAEDTNHEYCLPLHLTARPRIPEYCNPFIGKCDYPPPDYSAWTETTDSLEWDWVNEKHFHPDHLPNNLFYHAPTADGKSTYLHSNYPFMIGSEVGRNALPDSAWGYKKTNQMPYVFPAEFGQEPDVDISVVHPGTSWSVQSRRLRSFVGRPPYDYIADQLWLTERGYLTESHEVIFNAKLSTPNCTAPKWHAIDAELVNIVLPPDLGALTVLPISIISQPRGWALVTNTEKASAELDALLDLSEGLTFSIILSGETELDLQDVVAAAPAGADVIPLAVTSDEASAMPELLVVFYAGGTREVPGTWLRLVPTGVDAQARALYAVESTGFLPADFEKGVLLPDSAPDAAAVFVEPAAEQSARLWRFDSDRWTESPLPSDLARRSRAAYLLHHGVLFRAGGMDANGNVTGDLLALETHSGGEFPTQGWLPRLDPALAWDAERGGLVYGGGYDASGQRHSDLWIEGIANSAPQAFLPDAFGPDAPRITSASLVIAGAETRQALVLGTAAVGPIAAAWHGALDGWHPRNLLALGDTSSRDRCADGSTARLCADGASWWGEPGHFACSPAPAGTCAASSQPALIATHSLPVQQARSADLDVMTTWVGANTHVQEWSATDPPVLRGSLGVGAAVTSVRASNGVVAVSTKGGLVIITRQDGVLHASQPLALCGRPLDAEPLPGGRWAVTTSAGFAIVSIDESGAPHADEAALLLPEATGWTAIPAEPNQAGVCDGVDNLVCAGGRCADGRARAALARVGDQLVIAPAIGATDSWLHGVGNKKKEADPPVLLLGRDTTGWHVLSQAGVLGTVQALRSNGNAVYAVTLDQHGNGSQLASPTLEVTGDQLLVGSDHDVSWWVTRRDTADRRLRVVNGQIEIAVVGL
jgi:hypothetical protein